ncbi:squalene synthase HpnC [Uliginosibacterium sp. 31-16]|uniref:squalene synthase HpnC n=1 Tax=Uliginosibacterium sp. 31-16 TaxID=3068315 RepID=UPI00273FCEB0|nr:squalene synthase HpnC [Uliginosibacterium sp. 31-16]MDP5239608.1 squalene synthase HpnC [Uliginosibacterium sp. 31-16]
MPVDHYENFPVASVLLPRRLREPVEAIYAFARSADDIADEGYATNEARLAGLAAYQRELDVIEAGGTPSDAMFSRLARNVREWSLPIQLLRDLLDAFAQDVVKKRYADFPDVLDYCRRSANPVGRLLLHLYGEATPENLRRSDLICSALQIINFWQDVGVDWAKDRVYLPQDSLVRFGVSEAQIAAGTVDAAFRALMQHEVQRARAMMLEGAPLATALPGRVGWELRLVVQGGLRILEQIEAADYDVFKHRPVLGKLDWLRLVLRAIRMNRQ